VTPVTRLLEAAHRGDPLAAQELLPLVYDELRKLAATREAEPLAEEFYLAVLARRPTADEATEVKKMLDSARSPAGRKELLQAMLWGLLLSAEFRLNH
jgi:hypothetical protein